jgi:hypothetical protein
MRARLALLCTFAMTGCTRDNPAFEDSTGTGETTASDSDSTTLTSVDVESGSEQETVEPVCDLEPGVPLKIDLGPNSCADYPEAYDRYAPLVMIEGDTLWVGTCDVLANTCDPDACETQFPIPLTFEPLDLTGIAAPGDCLHIHARRALPTDPVNCHYQSVLIDADNGLTRRPVLIGRNDPGIALPPIDNTSPLFGFSPTLTFVESCSCADFPDECCGDAVTTEYALNIGQQLVHIGETVTIDFPNEDYNFTTLDAFQLGECGKPTQEAWGLVKALP